MQEVASIAKQEGRQVRIAEVGTWVGEAARAMADCIRGSDGSIVCIDHFRGSTNDATGAIAQTVGEEKLLEAWEHNTGSYRPGGALPHIEAVNAISPEAATLFTDGWFDLVYLDAGHAYHEIQADIDAWLPKVRSGGVLCGHDYCDSFPGVRRAADELGIDGAEHDVWWRFVSVEREPPQGVSLSDVEEARV